MAFRIFRGKKYHLGMTGDEVKAALQGGGGGDKRATIADITFTADLTGTITNSSISFADLVALHQHNKEEYVRVYVKVLDSEPDDYGIMTVKFTYTEGVGITRIDFASAFDLNLKTERGFLSGNSMTWYYTYHKIDGWTANDYPTISFYDMDISASVEEG